MRGWRLTDQVAFVACWAAGLLLCAVAATIVLYMAVQGIRYLNLDLITSSPVASLKQDGSGGFLDPIVGTVLLTVIGIVVATPLAVISALWLVEYGRPRWLARIVESAIEVDRGHPVDRHRDLRPRALPARPLRPALLPLRRGRRLRPLVRQRRR